MKLERIGEWVEWEEYHWIRPNYIHIFSVRGEQLDAGGGIVPAMWVVEAHTCHGQLDKYFKTKSEALEFAREIMGGDA